MRSLLPSLKSSHVSADTTSARERSLSATGIPALRSTRRRAIRTGVAGVLTLGMALVAIPADAHIAAAPGVVKPGAKATVTFTVPHGCGASPTIKLAIKLPASVSGISAVAPKGWTGTVAGTVATFTGGPLPVKQKLGFGVTFTAPKTEGTLEFPTIQTCVKGETSWIQKPLANGDEPDYPAPSIKVSSTAKAKAHKH